VLSNDPAELPTRLVAMIFTLIKVPCGIVKGAMVRVARGTLQVKAPSMVELDPSQVAVDSLYTLVVEVLIKTW